MRFLTLSSLTVAAGMAVAAPALVSTSAVAKSMSANEVRSAMLGKTIKTRRFGIPIRMRYRSNGTVSVSSPVGSVNGTWRPRGNAFCTTFKEGPAKGTDCVTFTKIGANRYRTSAGQSFSVSP